MSSQSINQYPFVKTDPNRWRKEKGLSKDAGNAKEIQTIECPHCSKKVNFDPSNLIWDSDSNFEFLEVFCPECDDSFELAARFDCGKHEFFTN